MLVPKERLELSQGVTSADFESAASTVPPLRPEVSANYTKFFRNVSDIRQYRGKVFSFSANTSCHLGVRTWRNRSLRPDKYVAR